MLATQQKPLVKKITKTGPNGSFTGTVTVIFAFRVEPNPNPNIHNRGLIMRDVHLVRGQAEELTYVSPEFFLKEDAVSEARKIEILVNAALEKMANEPKEEKEPVNITLKTLGYE
jgi:hypothetical protein